MESTCHYMSVREKARQMTEIILKNQKIICAPFWQWFNTDMAEDTGKTSFITWT